MSNHTRVGYVVVTHWRLKTRVIWCLQAKDTSPNARGQNAEYIYQTEYQGGFPTLLRAVHAMFGHGARCKLTFLNMVCCEKPVGFCHCPGLGVSV